MVLRYAIAAGLVATIYGYTDLTLTI